MTPKMTSNGSIGHLKYYQDEHDQDQDNINEDSTEESLDDTEQEKFLNDGMPTIRDEKNVIPSIEAALSGATNITEHKYFD